MAIATEEPLVRPERKPAPPTRGLQGQLQEIGELVAFSLRALRGVPGSIRYISEALRHAAMMMQGTLVLLFVMCIFLGVSTGNFGFFFLRSIGAADFIGLVSGYADPRQVGVTMFGYVVTAKICCGMAAELGAMKIQQEVDAFESTGVDSVQFLVGTRVLAMILFLPVAVAVTLLGAFAGTYLLVVVVLDGVPGNVVTDVHWSIQTLGDQMFAFAAMAAIGISGTLIACFYGLRTKGGPASVGSAVARSILVNLVVLHLIAVIFAVTVYGTDQRLPIGGG